MEHLRQGRRILFIQRHFGRVEYSYTYHPQSITLFPFPAAVGAFLQGEVPTRKMDLRTLVSSQEETPATFRFEFTLPETLAVGPASLALIFRDPAPSLSTQPAYALPLNSVNENGASIFDAATGYNLVAAFNVTKPEAGLREGSSP
jgi:hypothetical protein